MTAYYQYCRMGEKGGVNFGGSPWQVDRKTDPRWSCRPSYSWQNL